jgi:DNA-3-methyladenine glycosylase
MGRLNRSDYDQETLVVARGLIGKRIVFKSFQGIITETEAYIGENDPACHAARGRTARTAVMFGLSGFSYVYLIYGMYHCLNIVTEKAGFPAAVLIRGVYVEGTKPLHLNGPGKLCRYLGITKDHNKLDLTLHPRFFVEDIGLSFTQVQATPRIGIKVGTDKLWRFVVDPGEIRNAIT